MSVTSETNRTAELTTNGVVEEFDFDMLIHDESEVQVRYKPTGGTYGLLILNTDYGVVYTENGGTVSTNGYIIPLAAGKLLIIRHLPITQQTNWLYNDVHAEQQHQDDFDRSVMRDLQIQEQLNRCVGFAIHSSTSGIEFPEPEADNIIGWNAAGTALENKTIVSITDMPILPPADGNFVVGDGTNWIVESGATVRDSLGFGLLDSPVLTGLTLSGLTEGSVLFAGVAGVISQDNDNFFFDDANNTLRIKRVLAGGVY